MFIDFFILIQNLIIFKQFCINVKECAHSLLDGLLLSQFSRFGSVKFAILTVVFTLATSLTYVGLVWGATEVLENYSYMKQCAIGFSGK